MHDFSGQRVLIVGGSSGIGAATAQAFAAHGAEVTLAARHEDSLQATARSIGGVIRTRRLDTADNEAIEAMFTSEAPFEHIVVSAARTPSGAVRQLPLEDAYSAMQSKFWGAYRIARAARITTGGSLTLVSGFLSVRPSKSAVLQGAINAALEALARGLALELAPVRVNAVSPGLVATPLWSDMAPAARQQMFEAATRRLPVGRVGQPQDIANAILYLAATTYASGSTVRVDGGGAIA